MFWFILTGIIALVVVGFMVYEEANSYHGAPFLVATMGLIGGVFCAFLIGMLGNLFGSAWTDIHWVSESQSELLTLQDSTGTGGSFFLGTGTVDEEASFFYYEKLERGAHLTSIDADQAIIIEEDIDKPYLEVLVGKSDNTLWLVDFLAEKHAYEFHIPKGSIVTNYSLDAQ